MLFQCSLRFDAYAASKASCPQGRQTSCRRKGKALPWAWLAERSVECWASGGGHTVALSQAFQTDLVWLFHQHGEKTIKQLWAEDTSPGHCGGQRLSHLSCMSQMPTHHWSHFSETSRKSCLTVKNILWWSILYTETRFLTFKNLQLTFDSVFAFVSLIA